MFNKLLEKLKEVSKLDFQTACLELEKYINNISNFTEILAQIGTIPEKIEYDSSEEKLFSKISDMVLARAFREIGLKATVLEARGDSADIQAKSIIHGYTLVADAKVFRMSRTAKNQKDFKVTVLSGWRKDNDFAILCSPYFQYPKTKSQIYAQALNNNVCLFSWEHLIFLIENKVKENADINFKNIWNSSAEYAKICVVAENKNCFIDKITNEVEKIIASHKNFTPNFNDILTSQIKVLSCRGEKEKNFWINEEKIIKSYSLEKAISELIKTKKINEKIFQIDKYIKGLKI